HHLFQPLLYQVATAAVSPADVAVPVRSLFRGARNIRVLHDEVTDVDVTARAVVTPRGRYDYDYLILATGSEYTYFGKDQWRAHAVSLKSLEDALIMREKILLAFERAEMESDAAARRKLMTFIVIGGGPTGVELAGAIAELAKSTLARDFRQIVPGEAAFVLLEAGPTLLNGFPPRLIAFAQRALERKGVTVRLDTPVEDIRDDGVIVGQDNELIPAATVLWAAGTRAGSVGDWLGAEADRSGRVKIGADLSVPDHPEIFVIGDAAHCTPAGDQALPGVAPVAKQQGAYAAKAIGQRVASGGPPGPFRYRDEGMLATIGRGAAVANLHWIKLTGWIAWMFWGLVHIYFLIGFRTRMMVFLNWVWTYFTYGLGARLITGRQTARRTESTPNESERRAGGTERRRPEA
ncbi:MAG: NAD(P)/FAD-dependent oxidoreductase, partial [Alphaproteobacteria bacterium]|nr:NAD(P)/FAD-dependent oxidoreductase [Alphaproteobacteria bacterium]